MNGEDAGEEPWPPPAQGAGLSRPVGRAFLSWTVVPSLTESHVSLLGVSHPSQKGVGFTQKPHAGPD